MGCACGSPRPPSARANVSGHAGGTSTAGAAAVVATAGGVLDIAAGEWATVPRWQAAARPAAAQPASATQAPTKSSVDRMRQSTTPIYMPISAFFPPFLEPGAGNLRSEGRSRSSGRALEGCRTR
jgi:hypothetical protein